MQNQFIAHIRKSDGEPQYLWEHLEETAELTGRFAGLYKLYKRID